jgi:hypothetical protein
MKFIFRYQKAILIIAALFNIIGAIITILSPSFFFDQFFKYPPDPTNTFPYLAMYHYLFWSVVLIMGIAYWMTAIDPVKNKIVLFIGSLGKLIAVAFWIMLYAQGHGKWGMLAAVGEDGTMGLIMAAMYWGKKPINNE